VRGLEIAMNPMVRAVLIVAAIGMPVSAWAQAAGEGTPSEGAASAEAEAGEPGEDKEVPAAKQPHRRLFKLIRGKKKKKTKSKTKTMATPTMFESETLRSESINSRCGSIRARLV
jgi:hypothetical protein